MTPGHVGYRTTMDALDLLTNDHNRVRGLFARFKSAHEREDAATMAEVTALILSELDVHARVEEEIFYPDVKGRSDELAEVVAEGVEEHHVAKMLMGEITGMPAGTEQWVAKVTVLIESVEHHAEEEETAMFPKVRTATAAPTRDDLGVRLDRRKQELGAPPADALIDLSKEELLELARQQEISGRSTMTKEELAGTAIPPR